MIEKKVKDVVEKKDLEETKTGASKTKTTAKKSASRTTQKKTATKTTKKTTGKKTTTKKVPKSVFVEFNGAQSKIDVEHYENKIKEIWLNDWNRLAKDLKQIDIYIKPEDGKVYFVVNGTEHGAIEL